MSPRPPGAPPLDPAGGHDPAQGRDYSAPGTPTGSDSAQPPYTGGLGGRLSPQRGPGPRPGEGPGPRPGEGPGSRPGEDSRGAVFHWPPKPEGRGGRAGWASLIRPFLVVCIFILAAALYSAHFTDVMDRLRSELAVSDAAGMLSPDELKLASDFAKILHQRVGLELKLATFAGEVKTPALDPRTIFIGLSRDGGSEVVLPPLAQRALGPEAANYLEKEHFSPYLAEGRAGEGLRRALKLLWDGLIGPGDANEL